jgi:hypothetical protein
MKVVMLLRFAFIAWSSKICALISLSIRGHSVHAPKDLDFYFSNSCISVGFTIRFHDTTTDS